MRASQLRAALVLGVALVLSVFSTACGEEEGPQISYPSVGTPILQCGPWLGEGRVNYDGDVLQRLEVLVLDADEDVVRVSAIWRGSILELEAQDGGLYVLETASMEDAVLRCDPPADLLIRAEDSRGNVTELLVPEM